MAQKKIFGGSSVGPLLYDDSIALDDPDGDFAGVDFHALVTDGQLWVEEAPSLDEHVVRLVDLASAAGLFLNKFFPNPASADQGKTAVANADGYLTVKDIVDAIGVTENATIVFQHSGAADTTEYDFGTAENVPANIAVMIEPGAVLIDSAAVDLTIAGPFWALRDKCFTWGDGGNIFFRSAWNNSRTGVVFPEWFGALPDGVTDCEPAINMAIGSFNGYGGVVDLSTGVYHIHSTINCSHGITIIGKGCVMQRIKDSAESDPYVPPILSVADLPGGTWIGIDDNITAIELTGEGGGLKNFGMWWEHDAPEAGWAPTTYGPAIYLTSTASTTCKSKVIEDILMLNPYLGIIQKDGNGVESLEINRVQGQAMSRGLWIKASAGICRITNIHFAHFWSHSDHVFAWKELHGYGFRIDRADGHQYNNWSANNYLVAFYFGYEATGLAHSMLYTNFNGMYADGVKYGVYISADAEHHRANFSNIYINCHSYTTGTAITDSRGWFDAGDACDIQINNIIIQNTGLEGIAVGGTGNDYVIDNIWIHDYANDTGTSSSTNITAGNSCYFGSQRRRSGAQGAATWGGAGTIKKGSVGYGAWLSRAIDTEYTATTDGTVVAHMYLDDDPDWGHIRIETPTGTARVYDDQHHDSAKSDHGRRAGVSCPVKAGNTWKAVSSGALSPVFTVWWIPTSDHAYN